jgi:hypothetical protein
MTGHSAKGSGPKPPRKRVSEKQRQRILKLYWHRCAICAANHPEVHHIDEDRANNDDMNLLPLCSNCHSNYHLADAHDPTAPMDTRKLRLFRAYRDPSILAPEFHPIFRRLAFVLDPTMIESLDHARKLVTDLVAFVKQFEMGMYYHVQVNDLLEVPSRAFVRGTSETPAQETRRREERAEALRDYQRSVAAKAPEVLGHIIDMLRYQPWADRVIRRLRKGRR